MAEDTFALTTFYTSWKAYQDHLAGALTPLTADQLALRAAPTLRSISEIALHIIGCRMYWFTGFLGEDASETTRAYMRWNSIALGAPYGNWNDVALALGTPAPTGAELAQGVDRTWSLMADCLARWSPADMRLTFPDVGEDGAPTEISRARVVWHVLEHDLHHGGELSLTLGIHRLESGFTN